MMRMNFMMRIKILRQLYWSFSPQLRIYVTPGTVKFVVDPNTASQPLIPHPRTYARAQWKYWWGNVSILLVQCSSTSRGQAKEIDSQKIGKWSRENGKGHSVPLPQVWEFNGVCHRLQWITLIIGNSQALTMTKHSAALCMFPKHLRLMVIKSAGVVTGHDQW